MHGRRDPDRMKNRAFAERLGFGFAGLRLVLRRERSFRAQSGLAAAAAVLVASAAALLVAALMLADGLSG